MSKEFETLVQQLVVERGLVPQEKLVECLREVGSDHGESTKTSKLSDVLIAKGYLEKGQVEALRKEISDVISGGTTPHPAGSENVMIGQLLIARKLITQKQLEEALGAQAGSGQRLGEVLIKRGFLSFDALEKVAESQKHRTQLTCGKCSSGHSVGKYDAARRYVCAKCGGSLVARPGQTSASGIRGGQSTVSSGVTKSSVPEAAQRAMANPKNTFGKYSMIRELGRGGMGAVYQAWDTKLRRLVAIKVLLHQGRKEEVERFYREAQTAASLKHDNIVAIFEVDQHEKRHFIAMEYIEGKLLAGQRLPIRRACEILRDIAEAVGYAHDKGVIHRDIKPQNIIIDPKDRPHVMDFGLAKSLSGESSVTVAGTIIGTPSYMSPEQAEGKQSQIDRQSDVYALGAVLYEAVTGRPPFKGATPIETLKFVVSSEPKPPSELNSVCPPEIETVILKALEKDKAHRYPSAKAFAKDLESWLAGGRVSASRVGGLTLIQRKLKRSWAPVVTFGLAVLIPIVLLVSAMRSSTRRDEQVAVKLADAQKFMDAFDYERAVGILRDAKSLDEGNGRFQAMIDKCAAKITEKRVAAEASAKAERERNDKERKEREESLARQAREFEALLKSTEALAAEKKYVAAAADCAKAIALAGALARPEKAKLEERLDELQRLGKEPVAVVPPPDDREKLLLKAQPEFARGQSKLESTTLDLYKPGADLARRERTLQQTVAHFTAAIDIYPRHHEAFLLRGRAYAGLYDVVKAEADFTRAIDLVPNWGAPYWERGRLHLNKFVSSVTLRSSRAQSRGSTADESLKKAMPDLVQAQKLGGFGDDASFVAATIAYGQGKFESAIALCDVLVAGNDTKEEVFKLRADARYLQSFERDRRSNTDIKACVADYARAIELRANYYEAYAMRGAIRFELRDSGAVEDFKRAVAINARDSFSHMCLGIFAMHGGDEPAASVHIEKAVELDPGDPRVWGYRCVLRLKQLRFSDALDDANRALKGMPDDPYTIFHRGQALLKLDRFKEALADFERCRTLKYEAPGMDELIAFCRKALSQ